MSVEEIGGIEKLRKLIDEDPSLYALLTGKKPAGRPKGMKNKNTLEPGKQIEIIKETEAENDQPPVEISVAEAKRLLKATRKPRSYTEEQRQTMLQNLQKGREKLLQQKKQVQEEKLKQAAKIAEQAKKTTVIKKYVIKKRKTPEPREESNSYQHSESEPSEDEDEILNRLQKKEKIINKINALQNTMKPTPIPFKSKAVHPLYNPSMPLPFF